MLRMTLRSLLSRRLRTALTISAILLGVAMISGTYVLTDQITNGFDEIFATAFEGTSVVVSPKQAFSSMEESSTQTMSASLVDTIRTVPGVAEVGGSYEAMGAVVLNGKPVSTGGAPTLIMNSAGEGFDASTFVAGAAPTTDGQVAVNRGFAEKQNVKVGDRIGVATATGLQKVTVCGVYDWADAASLGGTIMVIGTLADVQRWFDVEGRLNGIQVAAAPGTTSEQLAADVRTALPNTVEVKTGEQAAAQASESTSDAINSFLRPVLLAFGGVAVFVGAFIIFNAFSITVAQRMREFALLRALGSSRRQVLTAVVGEALLMGVLASVGGLFSGFAVAKAINALFKALGVDIPTGGMALEPRTVVVALAVGIGVTLLAALTPALRATRVPPVAALQEGATLPPSRLSRLSTPAAIAVATLGAGAVAVGFFGSGTTTTRLLEMGLGAMLLFVAIAMVSRFIVRPAARVIGWPLERLAGTSGRLARDNAARNPARTASTAAALMIGLGLVVFVAVFAQGLKTSFVDSLDRTNRADVVITDDTAFSPLPTAAAKRLRALPDVELVTGATEVQCKLRNGAHAEVTGLSAIDPATFSAVWAFDWVGGGSDELVSELGNGGALFEEQFAKARGIRVGDVVTVTAQNGRAVDVQVTGIYRDPMLFNTFAISTTALKALDLPAETNVTLVNGRDGVDPTTLQAEITDALAEFPVQTARTESEYVSFVNDQINQILMLLYALLAMSVTISAFGIVNTLVLSVYERTREIGMLRAIGTSRRQMRRIVRYESVITSVIGGLLGTVVGVIFAYAVTTRFDAQGFVFSVPFGQLVIFLLVAVVVGVLAAVLPARRAARIDILDAIHYE